MVTNKDLAHLLAAFAQSLHSKDPSTKVGALVLNKRGRVKGTGYNGFASGVPDEPALYNDRGAKYLMVRHAEENALAVAGGNVRGGTLYATSPICSHCASDAIQYGIKRVVYIAPPEGFAARWGEHQRWADWQFAEAGVTVEVVGHDQFAEFARGSLASLGNW
jgi:dCMP deaminase